MLDRSITDKPEEIPPDKVSTDLIRVVIAHYHPYAVSGAEQSIADLVAELDPRFRCSMLVPGEGNLADYYRRRGFDVWVQKVETPRRLYPGLHEFQSYRLAQRLREKNIDVILSNTFSAASRVKTAARLASIPFGMYIREFISDRPVHRQLLDRADRVFTISTDLQSYIRTLTRKPEKVLLTYNHILPGPILARAEAHRKAAKRLAPFGIEHPVVGLIGRITRFKQQDLFVRAIPYVLRDVPEARFVIVGSAQEREKDYENEVKRLAVELGVEDKVSFMGQRKDTIELTCDLTISCVTSDREPLGRVILEAALVGCPVVVPDTGGPAEIVDDEVTGLKFSSIQPDGHIQLARQIVRLLQNPRLRQALASAAEEKISSTFAGSLYVRTQEEYIEQLAILKQYR
ncbi:MAG TPA: glycosyltransferase family 4 protein [Anaerolineaceae bacterium]|nr:glycosyltransferase family 4 protein [Anaerolineaceae bacterium]